jgi:tRNA pseudouridine38-40 synthase
VNDRADQPVPRPVGDGLIRLRLDLAYDGTDFSGWARQPARRTVEGVLADAFATVLRLPVAPSLVVAGRTDAGVHASGQVAHVDLETAAVPDADALPALERRLAGVLPDDVAIQRVSVAPQGFDARFSAVARHYRYRITDRGRNPLRRRDTLAWPRPLDADAMHHAAQRLVGQHDFAAYCKPREGATTLRTLHALAVTREAALVLVEARGNAFCHNQVRAMVGALLAVGDGRRPPEWPGEVLAGRVRDSAVTVAPPHGLTLTRVDYPSA